MRYFLKHKDIPVMLFSMDEEYLLYGDIEVLNRDHVPFGRKYTYFLKYAFYSEMLKSMASWYII
jgi:hypothetical protein